MKYTVSIFVLFILFHARAQFHTLTMPKASPSCSFGQQIGVTFMSINYDSPAVNGRDVWNDPNVIPQNADPIAWRAGANENTVIQFDTDVTIEGQILPAGSYGFHIIPNGREHELLFAQPDNLWGSYYLNIESDVALRVTVKDTHSTFHEYLSYTVIERSPESCIVALRWGDRMIPFEVGVNVTQTALEKWRYELNGENTYRWQAWNDAAAWCLRNNINLEEALTWANRSLQGGYGGFASHYSFYNLATKIELLHALNRSEELQTLVASLPSEQFTTDECINMVTTLLRIGQDAGASDLLKAALRIHNERWELHLYQGVTFYFLNQSKAAFKSLKRCKTMCPEWFQQRLEQIQEAMSSETYQFPNRNI